MGRDRTGWDGTGRDGMGRDVIGQDGTGKGRDGTGRDGTGRDRTGRGRDGEGTGKGRGRDGEGTGREGGAYALAAEDRARVQAGGGAEEEGVDSGDLSRLIHDALMTGRRCLRGLRGRHGIRLSAV